MLSRMAIVVLTSTTMTMLIATMVTWAFEQSGHRAPLSVLLWMLFPATFFLSSTIMEYLEDGNIARALRASLFYTGIAAALILVLYSVALVVSPRPRLARNHQRPAIETASVRIPINVQGWKSQAA